MHDVELRVAQMLAERSMTVTYEPGNVGRVIERSRRRRMAYLLSVSTLGVVLVMGGSYAATAVMNRDGTIDPAGSSDKKEAASGEPLDFARPVISGVHAGEPWWLFDSENSSNCPQFAVGDRFLYGAAGPSCATNIRSDELYLSRGVIDVNGFENFSPVYGVAGEDVVDVEIVLEDTTYQAQLLPVRDHPELSYFFYVLDKPIGEGTVVGLDDQTRVARILQLCEPKPQQGVMQVCSEVSR